MNELFKFREWLNIEEASNHISSVIGKQVTSADIYRLALDGHLKISANFVNHVAAKYVKLIKTEDLEYKKVFPLGIKRFPKGGFFKVPTNGSSPISKDYWFHYINSELINISGVWDLTMHGNERLYIEQQYQHTTSSKVIVDIPAASGIYLQQENRICQLHIRYFIEPQHDEAVHYDGSVNDNSTEDATQIKLKPRRIKQTQSYLAKTLDEQEHVLIVREKEVTRIIQFLGGPQQEVKPPASKAYTKNRDKQKYNKRITEERYAAWKKEAKKIRKRHPNKPKDWISKQIAKLPIAEGRNASTIKKNIEI